MATASTRWSWRPTPAGVPGLLEAARDGGVRIVNYPGTSLVEAPALAAFLPALARHLLGEELALPGVETHWLDDLAPNGPAARDAVLRDPDAWLVRPAFDANAPPVDASRTLPRRRRAQGLLARIAAAPGKYVARSPVTPSAAPCLDGGQLVPRPLLVRLFLAYADGAWRAMQGGLGCALPDGAAAWPVAAPGLAKDVWVLAQDPLDIAGPPAQRVPALAIRRTAGDLPSRAADNFFWLGRYLERLEGAARLLRAALTRLARPAPAPHELAELEVLTACLTQAGVLNAETVAGLSAAAAVRGAAARRRAVGRDPCHDRPGVAHDRPAARPRHRRDARGDGRAACASWKTRWNKSTRARTARRWMPRRRQCRRCWCSPRPSPGWRRRTWCAAAAGCSSTSAGGWNAPRRWPTSWPARWNCPARTPSPRWWSTGCGWRWSCAISVITYRSRYSGVLQPAPALDLMLADQGNPRGLAFQLVTAASAAERDRRHAGRRAGRHRHRRCWPDAEAMVRGVAAAPDQARAATLLPPRLRELRDAVAELSDRVSRRYFALLPTARSVGLEGEAPALLGAA